MIPPNATYAQIGAIVDELARCGMRRAVASPGSRNAPIALVLAGDERIETTPVIDERAAGFMALGMAKASGRPVAVTCTSGTAAANLLPAVVEAHEARVPLIVLTADRPPELREVGAGQAIDQIGLYGRFAKWFVEVGNGEPEREWAVHLRALACRAFWTAAGGRPGPVHLNLPLREPLAPVAEGAVEAVDPSVWAGRPGGAPWTRVERQPPALSAAAVEELAARIAAAPRGAIVCGSTHEDAGASVARLAAVSGWPVLAEPTSGVRCGHHDLDSVVAHYDALLRSERFAGDHLPDLVLRIGDTPTSKPLRAWLARAAEQVVVDAHLAWHEPTRSAATIVHAEAAGTAAALAEALEHGARAAPDAGWMRSWRAADDRVPPLLAAATEPFEPLAYTAIAPDLPDGALVWVGSSMAIRDVETFFPRLPGRVRLLSNRGANGIDGVVASAAGAALATGAPTWLLIGDVSLLHDVGGLVAAAAAGVDLRIVCVDNRGGGIFDFLPVAQSAEPGAYERHIATPPGVELAHAAALAGIRHTSAATAAEVRAAAAEPGLIVVRTERAENVAAHRALLAEIAAAITA